MTHRQRIVFILIGLAGGTASLLALVAFLLKMMRNGLVLPASPTAQAFYQTVGSAYADGFVAGFALCFFLTLLAVAVGSWFESRGKAGRASIGEPVAEERSVR